MATTVFPRPSASYAQVKTDKVANATNGNIPGLNAAGNLTDSGYAPDDLIEILEYANQSSFPASGESGKIYVALDTNLTYRWSGSAYVQTGNSLALGETSSTAYRGDRGAAAYAAAVTNVGGANLAAEAIIVPEYDATATYAVGALRTHGGKLYTCNTAIETAEAWNSSHWTETSVDNVYAPKANPVFTGSISLGRTPTTNVGTRIGANSYAVGDGVRATQNNAHAEGYMTQAIAANAHAEGESTYAMATASHAEGHDAWAIGTYSHAEGYGTYANDSTSHAEGYGTDATGNYSHAEGYYTKAKGKSQHVSGEYNVEDSGTSSARGTYAEIVGNGTSSSTRSNARTLDWSGNERLKGELYVGCNNDSTGGTAVGAKLSQVSKATSITSTTFDAVKSGLISAVGSIGNGESILVKIDPAFTGNEYFEYNTTYVGYVERITANYFVGSVVNNYAKTVVFSYGGSSWNFRALLLANRVDCASLDAVKTHISNVANTMSNYEIRPICFGSSFSDSDFSSSTVYSGFIERISANIYHVTNVIGLNGESISIGCNGGSNWQIKSSKALTTALANKVDIFAPSVVMSSLSEVGVNTVGRMRCSSSISPTGTEKYFNFTCSGTSERRTIVCVDIDTNKTYVNSSSNSGSTWSGWQELALNSQLTKSRTVLQLGTGLTGAAVITRFGHACVIDLLGINGVTAAGTEICKVPTDLVPKADFEFPVIIPDSNSWGSGSHKIGMILVKKDTRQVLVYCNNTDVTGASINGNGSYILDY